MLRTRHKSEGSTVLLLQGYLICVASHIADHQVCWPAAGWQHWIGQDLREVTKMSREAAKNLGAARQAGRTQPGQHWLSSLQLRDRARDCWLGSARDSLAAPMQCGVIPARMTTELR